MRPEIRREVGRITYQSVLAAAAGTGEQPNCVSVRSRARSLGVSRESLADAQQRVKGARHDVPPETAVGEGSYLYARREKRGDATALEVTVNKFDIQCYRT